MNIAAFVVSILSLLIAGAAWVTSWRTQKRQLAIEEARERDRLRSSRKAQLRAEIMRSQGRHSQQEHLRILNTGNVEARDVKVVIDGQSLLEHAAIPQGVEERFLVGPGSRLDYLMALSMEVHPPFEIGITWTDDSGEAGSYRTTLT